MKRIMAALLSALFVMGPAAAVETIPHKIVSIDGPADARRIAVRIDARLPEAALSNLAAAISAKSKPGEAVSVISVFLPGGDLAHAPWATLKAKDGGVEIVVSGLSAQDEAAFRAEASADGRDILGVWLTSPPALPGRLTILRAKGGKLVAEWRLKSGQKTVDDLLAQKTGRGIRYDVVGGDGAYYLATWGGTLELGDRARVIAVAERLVAERPAPVAAAPLAKTPAVEAGKVAVSNDGKAGALAKADAVAAGEVPPGQLDQSVPATNAQRPRRAQKSVTSTRRNGAPVADLMGSAIAR